MLRLRSSFRWKCLSPTSRNSLPETGMPNALHEIRHAGRQPTMLGTERLRSQEQDALECRQMQEPSKAWLRRLRVRQVDQSSKRSSIRPEKTADSIRSQRVLWVLHQRLV